MHGVEHKVEEGEEVLTVANPHFEPWRSRSVGNMPVQSVSLILPADGIHSHIVSGSVHPS